MMSEMQGMNPAPGGPAGPPGAVMPKWSIAMYSEVVKQSWVSIPSMPSTPSMPARSMALAIVLRTCGSTYCELALSATLSALLKPIPHMSWASLYGFSLTLAMASSPYVLKIRKALLVPTPCP